MMLMSLLMFAVLAFAVPAKPGLTRLLTLSNGSTVMATLVGDEHGHYWQGTDGKNYQLIGGTTTYQEVNSQEVIQRAQQRRAQANQRRVRRMAPQRVGNVGSITGDKKGIIILVNFNDDSFTATQNDFYKLANQQNYNSGNYKGSMYDYFYAQSEGQFRLTFDVVGPYTVSNNCSYYGGNGSSGNDSHPAEMVIEALKLADQDVNYADYDWDGDGEVEQVYVVYAGKGEADGGADDTIWPHEWTLSSAGYYGDGTGAQTLDGVKIDTYACGGEQNGSTGETAGIGTMCHEFSHCLGYPDFYDTDYSGGQGMGYWDLMDSGSYNGNGYQPAGYTSYERWVAGWKTPVELVNTQTISNMAALQNGGSSYIIYNKANNNEYYLLENRQKTVWDSSLPGAGLLILHVDYSSSAWSNNTPNNDPSHQRMTWIPADNQYQYQTFNGSKYYTTDGMKNDPFPYGTVNAFGKNTTPAATLFNNNSDGTKYLDSSLENITQNSDGTISFDFVGISNVATPTFSPAGGRYADAQTVAISCTTTGAAIYYTLDGSTPTASSTPYTSALTISQTTTIKAVAVKDNEQSAVATATYKIGASASNPDTKTFKLVTSTDDLEAGMRYIIACGSQATAAGALGSQILASEEVTVNDDVITITDNVAVFVLNGDQTNGWTFQNESTNNYLSATAAKKLAYESSAKMWTLANSTAGVIMTMGSYGTMLYNVNSPRFTTYTSDPNVSMIQANLYMEYSEGTTPVVTTPELITEPEALSFVAEANASQTKTFDVLGAGLTGDVTVSLTDANHVFSVSSTTISKADAEEGATVSVTFTPTAAGSYTGSVTLTSAGADPVTVSLSATATESTTPVDPAGSSNDFALVTQASDFTDGDYIIVYDGAAMNTTVSSNRLQYTAVTPTNNVITTTDAAIIWHIAKSGSYYTIYNADANQYAASTGTKNQAQLLASGTDDKALWSVTTGTTFDFTNKYNSANSVNATLRRNGEYGFACYATATGGALSLYKRNGSSGGGDTPDPVLAYYAPADGKQNSTLKTAMCGIIYNRTEKSYDDLWTAFKTTDVRSDGKIWDMYSNITNYTPVTSGSSYSKEGDCYNREHSWPQSWFNSSAPMYTDLHHIYPTDGFVNGKRANYPFGEVANPTYSSNGDFSKLGPCTYSGYTGTVFEPADEYKGDFARTYFYMVTCYEEKLADWYTNYSSTDVVHVIDGSTYPALQKWQLNMLMEWAKNDPVSEKETARNEAVYAIQKNRNPFIDYPGLQEYIWGICKDDAFSYDNYVEPVYSDVPDDPDEPVIDSNSYVRVTDAGSLKAGDKILIAYVNGSSAQVLSTTQNANNRSATTDVTLNANGTLTPGTEAQVITLEKDGENFLFNVGDGYLYAASSSSNYLKTETTADANAKAAVSISSGNATITFQGTNTRNTMRYNPNGNNPIFACYASNTTTGSAPQIYRQIPTVTLGNATDNSSTIDTYKGEIVNVKLSDRTLYKDGSWNTLCLPFSLTAAQVKNQLDPESLMTLQSSSFSNGTLTLTFAKATSIEAGKPYIIKWTGDSPLESPTFTGVTIENATANVNTDNVDFIGIYSPLNITAADNTKLCLSNDNTLYYPNAAMTIGAFRAYFQLKGITAADLPQSAIVLNFDAEGTTGLNSLTPALSQGEGVYTLDGRKLNTMPTQKGVYIVNGNKVVIK